MYKSLYFTKLFETIKLLARALDRATFAGLKY